VSNLRRLTLDELRALGLVTRRDENKLIELRARHEVSRDVEASREAAAERKRRALRARLLR
jgi:hypothetical protein